MPIEKEELKQNAFNQIMKPDVLPPKHEVKLPEYAYRVSAPSKQDGHEVTFIVRSSISRDDLRQLVESNAPPKSEEGFKCQIIDPKKGKVYDVGMASVIAFVDGRSAKIDEAPKEAPKPKLTEEQKFAEAKRWTDDKKVDIAALQKTLVEIGYLKPGYQEGEFDRATYAAVIALQKSSRLTLDGKYGPQTLVAAQTLQSNVSIINAEETLVGNTRTPEVSAPTAQRSTKPIAQSGYKVGDETTIGRHAPIYVSQPAHLVTGEKTVRGDISVPGQRIDRKIVADVGHQVDDGLTSFGDQSDVGTLVTPNDKKKPKTPPG